MTMATGHDHNGDDVVAIEENATDMGEKEEDYPDFLSVPEEELIKLHYIVDYAEKSTIANRRPGRIRGRRNRQRRKQPSVPIMTGARAKIGAARWQQQRGTRGQAEANQ